jgi:hypothetical protein
VQNTFTTRRPQLKQLEIGGFTGKKYGLKIDNILTKSGTPHKLTSPLIFFVKHFEGSSFAELAKLVARNYIFFQLGFPVPPTARIFRYKEKLFVALTDVSQDAFLWGYNNNAHIKERYAFRQLRLTYAETLLIQDKIYKLARMATAQNLTIGWAEYHIRRNKKDNALDILLLDLAFKNTHGNRQAIQIFNDQEAGNFLRVFLEMYRQNI